MPILLASLFALAAGAPQPGGAGPGSHARLAQCPTELAGAWTATLPAGPLFSIRLAVREVGDGGYRATIGTSRGTTEAAAWRQGGRIRFQAESVPLAVDARVGDDHGGLDAFVRHAGYLEHVRIPRVGPGEWSVDWSPVGAGEPVRLDLYIDASDGSQTGAYFFFRDPRLPGLYGEGATCEDGVLTLRERNLTMRFEGRLDGAFDSLRLVVSAPAGAAPITLHRMAQEDVPESPDASLVPPRAPDRTRYAEAAPEGVPHGWSTAAPSDVGLDPDAVARLVESVVSGGLPGIHAVLVARHGRLVVEEYFYGFDRDTPHDLRSAAKTLASTLVGLAIREGAIESASAPALALLPYRRYEHWDPRKARITLRDLMTMSSGLDANDYDPDSPAAEQSYQALRGHADWVKIALDAPMIADPGSQPLYGGANPLILGGVLEAALDEPVEWFAHRTLFEPLGISGYRWFTMPSGSPYLGGGVHLKPRDMLRLGQLYLDGGVFGGSRVLPDDWVGDSWRSYGRLAPFDINGHEYGYLWWHHEYEVAGKVIRSHEARGYGGQYIFVVPELDLVAVVTAGNYRNGLTRQSEEVMARYVLPAAR